MDDQGKDWEVKVRSDGRVEGKTHGTPKQVAERIREIGGQGKSVADALKDQALRNAAKTTKHSA